MFFGYDYSVIVFWSQKCRKLRSEKNLDMTRTSAGENHDKGRLDRHNVDHFSMVLSIFSYRSGTKLGILWNDYWSLQLCNFIEPQLIPLLGIVLNLLQWFQATRSLLGFMLI